MNNDFNLIDAVDNIDKAVNLIRGARNAYHDAFDILQIPNDAATYDQLNDAQITAATLIQVVCDMLRTTSDNLKAYNQRRP